MKASGVSLIKTMKPLIALVAFIAIAAFSFRTMCCRSAQTKMWTLLYSMRQKSPELEIPEGVFYDQIQATTSTSRRKTATTAPSIR